MRRQFAQYAQAELAASTVATPVVGEQSQFFDSEDAGNPKRIGEDAFLYPIGGIRLINEGGKVGWSMALPRNNKLAIGSDAFDLTIATGAIAQIGAGYDDSIAIGKDTSTVVVRTTSIGYNILGIGGVALGRFNLGTADNIFEIGDGATGIARSNAFEVDSNSIAKTPNAEVEDITNLKHLVTLEKLNATVLSDIDDHTFAIKGTIEDGDYPGFMPYIAPGRSKKVIGIRWHMLVGTCTINVSEKSDSSSHPITGNHSVTSGTTGQFIWSDPLDYYDLTDGRRVVLTVSNNSSGENLSVTVILLNE